LEEERKKVFEESHRRETILNEIVVDTNVIIDYVNGYAPWIDIALDQTTKNTTLILPTIVLAEYYTSTAFEKADKIAIARETFKLFTRQPLTEEIAEVLGTLLRHKTFAPGASIADLIIAATALHLDVPLATTNQRDFARIPLLRFFDPKTLAKLH